MNTTTLRTWLRAPYAWPGGYEIAGIMHDGALFCHKCARENYYAVCSSTRTGSRDGWQFVGAEIIWEGAAPCDHCGRELAVYSEDTV